MTPFQWHAHEMIYGFSLAVIAGFLLTAARNWTGLDTLNGTPLLGLFGLWAAARVSMLFGTALLELAALFDILFILALTAAVASPIIRARMWRQAGHPFQAGADGGRQHRFLPRQLRLCWSPDCTGACTAGCTW
jgi:uncharacterized protein involved in response to NO